MSHLTLEQKILLELTAAILFNKTISIPENVDWQVVFEESCHQSVALQVFSAAQAYLPDDVRAQWSMRICHIAANNIRVEWEHTELHGVMTENRIPYVVMKGCASAAYYPDASVRTMGDVDFLIFPEDLDKAGDVLVQAGFTAHRDEDEDIHIAYHRGRPGARSVWEMHWEPNGVPEGDTGERIHEYLSTAIGQAVFCQASTGIYMGPSAFHHGLIMLLHTATHLINTGVGLRHLCDWAVFAGSLAEAEFCETFEERLKAVGLWRFAQLLTQLSTAYLGCPKKMWAGESNPDLLEAIIADIFAGGNFGRKDEQRINQAKLMTDKGKGTVDDTSLFRQLINTLNEKACIAMPMSKRCPIFLPIGWIVVGIRHIFRILTGKRPSINMTEMISGASARRDIYKEFKLFQNE